MKCMVFVASVWNWWSGKGGGLVANFCTRFRTYLLCLDLCDNVMEVSLAIIKFILKPVLHFQVKLIFIIQELKGRLFFKLNGARYYQNGWKWVYESAILCSICIMSSDNIFSHLLTHIVVHCHNFDIILSWCILFNMYYNVVWHFHI